MKSPRQWKQIKLPRHERTPHRAVLGVTGSKTRITIEGAPSVVYREAEWLCDVLNERELNHFLLDSIMRDRAEQQEPEPCVESTPAPSRRPLLTLKLSANSTRAKGVTTRSALQPTRRKPLNPSEQEAQK